MGEFFANKWTKRVVSLLSPLYCAMIVILSYFSIFYEMIVQNTVSVCVMISAISLIAAVIMLYTREQVLTIIVSLLMLPALLPAVLFYFGQWYVLIPPLVVALLMFFFSGLGETPKTIFGTGFLLLYLMGSLGYFLVTTLFAPSTVSTVIDAGESPSGIYRYEVVNTADRSDGSTTITIETNEHNKDYDLVLFRIRGLSRTAMLTRPMQEENHVEWKTEKRVDITNQIHNISDKVEVTLSEDQMTLLGRPCYKIESDLLGDGTMMAEEYHAKTLSLSFDQMAMCEIEESTVLLDSLNEKQLDYLDITITDLRTIPLTSLTDDDLTKLGIPEEGDVMYYNGKVCFRYYIAILEEYFDLSKQEIGFF